VIGIGKSLGLKIGQRNGLSALDAAQLNDMYQCQTKNKRGRWNSAIRGSIVFYTRCSFAIGPVELWLKAAFEFVLARNLVVGSNSDEQD
jgi:hypothetical protein